MGSFIMGPNSINPSQPWGLICMDAVLMGLCFGIVMITSNARAQKTIVCMGYDDKHWSTDATLCGAWSTAFYFSNFVGPFIAGILVQNLGFRKTATVYPLIYFFTLVINATEYLMYRTQYEYE